MAMPGGTEGKVHRLEGDIQTIYEMLATIQATQTRRHNRLNEVAGTQAEHSAVLAEYGGVLAEHGAKLDRIIALLEGH